jgi:hypothetical protein
MASISFTCPHCEKVLRTTTRPAPGKKIKCPACAEIFVPQIDDDEAAAIQANPSAKTKTALKTESAANDKKPARAEDDEDAPRKKAKRTDAAEADDDAPKKKSKRARDEDDDDEDDRPAKKVKKSKKKAGSMMTVALLAVAGVGVFLGLGACGIGAFVWPGFLRSSDKQIAQGGRNDLVKKGPTEFNHNEIADLVSPKSVYLIGFNTKALREANQLNAMLKKLDDTAALGNKMPNEYRDLLRTSDKMLIGVLNFGGKTVEVMAVLMPTAEALASFKSSPTLGAESKINDKYRVQRPGVNVPGVPKTLVYAGDRTVLLTDLPDDQIALILDPIQSKQTVPSPAAALGKTVEQAHIWAAVAFDDEVRKLFNDPGEAGKQSPELQQAFQVVQRAKGSSMAANFETSKWNVRLNVECANADDAKRLKDLADSARASLAKLLATLADFGQAPKSALSDFNSVSVQSQGATATLTAQVSQKTITDFGAKQPFDPKKNVASKDNVPKNVPNGTPPPQNLTTPKNVPPAGGSIPTKAPGIGVGPAADTKLVGPLNLPLGSMGVGAKREVSYQFHQGRTISIGEQSVPANFKKRANTHIEVLRGKTGNMVVAQARNTGNGAIINYVVTASDTYRIRITNQGPGAIGGGQVFIQEK